MSVTNIPNVAYGLSQPTINVSSPPIVSPRNPTIEDKATLGTIWINPLTNSIFILTSIVDNVAFWQTVSAGSGTVLTLDADTGSAVPIGGIINLLGGSNINTSAFGSTLRVNLDNSIALPNSNAGETTGVISFGGNPSIQNFGTNNFFLGANAGNFTLTTAMNNTATGVLALHDITIGSNNTADGYQNLTTLTSGSANSSIGSQGLISLVSGSYNIALGYQSGSNYTSGESSNIIIGNGGSNGESNTIRIGNQGSGAQQQDACYIAGIFGTSLTGSSVVITSSGQLGTGTAGGVVGTLTGNSGGAVGPSGPGNINIIGSGTVVVTGNPVTNTLTISDSGGGGGIAVLDGDTGSATGTVVTIAGGSNISTSATASTVTVNLVNSPSVSGSVTAGTGMNITTGDMVIANGNLDFTTGPLPGGTNGYITFFDVIESTTTIGINFTNGNTFIGLFSGNNTTTTTFNNCAVGYNTLGGSVPIETTGDGNSAFGTGSLENLISGANNTALGGAAGAFLVSGNDNVFVGNAAGEIVVTGSQNSVLGSLAYRNGDGSNNIVIGYDAGFNLITNSANNIIISNQGKSGGDQNTIRIGTSGSGTGEQNLCYIAGINGINVGSVASVVSISGDQLGFTTLTAGSGVTITPGAGTITIASTGGSGITTLDGDTGSATGSTVTIAGGTGITTSATSSTVTVNLTSPVVIANGGTDSTSFATNGVVISGTTGTSALTALSLTSGQIVIGGTGAPAPATLTAGANVVITNASNSITIAANSAAQVVNYTSVNQAASPYTVLATDYYLGVDSSGGVVTILLPNTPTTGRIFSVKDKTGSAATNNITITTVGGTDTIDGATSFVMNTNYEAASLIFNGTSYEIY